MSFRTELQLGLLLTLAITLAAILARSAGAPPPDDPVPSTFLAGPRGSKAPYDVLARLGQPVERRRTPLFDLSREPAGRRPAQLVLIGPSLALQTAELEEVVRYVRNGGAVVAVGNAGGLTYCFGWESQASFRRGELDSMRVVAAAALPGVGEPPRLPRVTRYLAPHEAEPDDTTPRWRAIGQLRKEGGCSAFAAIATDTLLRTAFLHRPVIVRQQYKGGGQVLLAADPEYFRNRTWRSSDVPLLITPLLLPPPPARGRVSWDEYHHGYGSDGSLTGAVLGWLSGAPGGWAMLQLLAVALVALALAAVRFGPALSVIERRRRSPLEHLEALGAGLEGAAGADTAVALIVAGLRRRLSRTGYIPRGDPGQWLAALELASPTAGSRTAVRRLQQLTTHPGGEERVLAAAQAVEDVWQDLRPRSTRDAS
jgi:uncharacterized protein DUF4350